MEISRGDLRSAMLRLVEASSSLGLAIGEVRTAVLVLQHVALGTAASDDPEGSIQASLAEAMQNLGAAFESLDAAGRTLGATDE